MGVVGNALSQCNDGKPLFKEGYSPDRCWFHNGYITSDIFRLFQDSIIGIEEWSDEDIVRVASLMNIYEGHSLTNETFCKALWDMLEAEVNKWQSNRGVDPTREGEYLIMTLMGWREYCIFIGTLADGANVRLCRKDGPNGRRDKIGFYFVRA